MSEKNFLDPKSQALFDTAYGGALDVRVVYSEQLGAYYLEVEVPDYDRYGPIISLKNLVAFVAEDGSTPVQSGGCLTYILGDAKRQRATGEGGTNHLLWCGIKAGGAFRRNADGSWRVEPDQKPLWWDDPDWATRLDALKKEGEDRIERYAIAIGVAAAAG